LLSELAGALDDRFTASPFERQFYRRDLAAVPERLAALIGRTLPDAVARPASAEEVAAAVRQAAAERVPITPRAAATTVYWNAVPVQAGLVLDLNGLAGLIALDEARQVAAVLPGTRWAELDRALRRRGYAVQAYPTSAPAATVGGWLSMEGYGIGSLQYGGLAGQVVGLEVVLPDGRIAAAGADPALPVAAFAGAEGTLGVVTRVDLAVRRAPAAAGHHLLAFGETEALQGALADLGRATPTPYYAHFAGPAYQALLRRAGFTPPSDQALLAFSYEGTAGEAAAGAAQAAALAAARGGRPLSEELAEAEWSTRTLALRLKRGGPTVLGSEFWLPVEKLAAYEADVARLGRAQRLEIATYGTLVAPGRLTVMALFPCDERRTGPYILALSLTRKLAAIALRHGGQPYGIGVWNSPYARISAERRALKAQLDPLNLMNPGKLYWPPWLLRPPWYTLGMDLLAAARRLM
jgi:glycolate oxidase